MKIIITLEENDLPDLQEVMEQAQQDGILKFPFDVKTIPDLSESEQARIGEKWAKVLMLKRSPGHKDRYDLTTGDKTALGLYRTLMRMIEDQ